jgi:radical SAM superfamily enzyme
MVKLNATQMHQLKELNSKLYQGINGSDREELIENFDEFLSKYEEFINFYEDMNYFKNSFAKTVYKKQIELSVGKKPANQDQAVLNWLLQGKTINQLQAIEYFGCLRLSAVIFRLRHERKYKIIDIGVHQWSEYKLINND